MLILLFLSFTMCQKNIKNENDLAEANLKGPIKRIITTGCSLTDSIDHKTTNCSIDSVVDYNKDGYLTNYTSIFINFNVSPNVVDSIVWKYYYDNKGKLIELSHQHGDGSIYGENYYRYDNSGNEIEWILKISIAISQHKKFIHVEA